MIRYALGAARALSIVALLAVGCSRDIPLGSDLASGGTSGTSGTGGTAGAPPVGGTSGTGGIAATGGTAGVGGSSEAGAAGAPSTCVKATCHGMVYACGDCLDNDHDGKIDAEDPECTGPCDDREDSFDVGLPGSNADKCSQDCFFDNGNGAGQDDCRFSHRCDMLSVAPDYPPTGSSSCAYDENAKIPGGNESCADLRTAQPAGCTKNCGPLTPNGCDCFGCCELPADSNHYVALGAGSSSTPCTLDNLDDPAACPPCTPVGACLNDCTACEVCVGRPEPLASCTGDMGACSDVFQPCDSTGPMLCPEGSYCITGCCVPEPH
jgi:hypothetical protein